jgi:hypothetical protein
MTRSTLQPSRLPALFLLLLLLLLQSMVCKTV